MGRTIETNRARPERPPGTRLLEYFVFGARKEFNEIQLIVTGRLDRESVIWGLGSSVLFFALGWICIELSRFGAALASVWLPAASAVVILLRKRLSNELPVLLGLAAALTSLNQSAGHSLGLLVLYTSANLIEVVLVSGLARRISRAPLDMLEIKHLGHILLLGGLLGPLASSLIVGISTAFTDDTGIARAIPWFFAHSMGMVLVLPAALLTWEACSEREFRGWSTILQSIILMAIGLVLVTGVFTLNQYSLLFLIPPVTLLMAFRVGGLGTALYVPAMALLASIMTFAGMGPIAATSLTGPAEIHLMQAFIAANFLTGLPIAAILSGRQRMTSELVAGRQQLALLTENVTDAVLRIDDSGVCTYASPSVQDVLGYSSEELVGIHLAEAARRQGLDHLVTMLDQLLSGEAKKERVTFQLARSTSDGAPTFVEADGAVAYEPSTGERNGIVVSARDVTERIELELMLTRARSKAEHAVKAKSEFLANMSHEIRTPMNGVLGFAELMLQGDLSEENRRHVDMIVQSGRSMMLLLNDILDLSKIEAGQISIHKAEVDLYATIHECVMLHQPVAEKKGLSLSFKVPCGATKGCSAYCDSCDNSNAHPIIVTDALRLRQIALNLIGNAVKFTETGRVSVSCEIGAGAVTISVEDTGIGIEPGALEKVFTPFTQAESDTARRFGGTGLGLTISRQLADLLGGKLNAKSTPGKGSVFRLTLPTEVIESAVVDGQHCAPSADANLCTDDAILDDAKDDVQYYSADDLQDGSPHAAPLPVSARILLVEDHDVNRMLAVEMLERCGQSVAVAHDGNEAIAMVIDSVMRDDVYDLVLMDVQMPGCDGYDATRAIRNEGIGPDVMPIIALTANAFPADIRAARAAGMQAHVPKPIEFSDLAKTLQRWLPTRIITAGETEGTAPEPVPISNAKADTARQHSPSLVSRWNERRAEAINAVRDALESGALTHRESTFEDFEALSRLVHKLAGTAAIFDEPELGDQAAALERALHEELPGDVRQALALELLNVADGPAECLAQAG